MPPDDQTVSAFRFIPPCCPMRANTVPTRSKDALFKGQSDAAVALLGR
jgi:hypothetical protein